MSNPNNAEVNRLTKESIAISAAKRLHKGKFQKATITEICESAGVSRKAFYRNFESITDPLKHYLWNQWLLFAQQHGIANQPQSSHAPYLLEFFYSERSFICDLRNNGLLYILETLLGEAIPIDDDAGGEYYYKYVVVYTIYGFVRAMIDRNFTDSLSQIEEMSQRFLANE